MAPLIRVAIPNANHFRSDRFGKKKMNAIGNNRYKGARSNSQYSMVVPYICAIHWTERSSIIF